MSFNRDNPKNSQVGLGMLSDLIALLATILSGGSLGFFVSLGFWIYGKDKVDIVNRSALNNSVNIQLNVLILSILSILVMPFLIGFILLPIVLTIGGTMHVVDAMRAKNNDLWTPQYIIKPFK